MVELRLLLCSDSASERIWSVATCSAVRWLEELRSTVGGAGRCALILAFLDFDFAFEFEAGTVTYYRGLIVCG